MQCTTEIDLTNYPSHNEVPSYDGNSSCDELPSYFTYLCKMNSNMAPLYENPYDDFPPHDDFPSSDDFPPFSI